MKITFIIFGVGFSGLLVGLVGGATRSLINKFSNPKKVLINCPLGVSDSGIPRDLLRVGVCLFRDIANGTRPRFFYMPPVLFHQK